MKGEEKGGFKEGGDERGKGIEGDEREGKKIVKNGECLVIDVEEDEDEDGRRRTMDSEKNSKEERVCRICHFSKEPSSKEVNLISLGCDCKGELASSHHHCAQTWFSHKGDRTCEICGKVAKNVSNVDVEETSVFMMEWNEMRMVAFTLDYSHESSRRCRRLFCNFLLACFILFFVLMWFFHGIGLV